MPANIFQLDISHDFIVHNALRDQFARFFPFESIEYRGCQIVVGVRSAYEVRSPIHGVVREGERLSAPVFAMNDLPEHVGRFTDIKGGQPLIVYDATDPSRRYFAINIATCIATDCQKELEGCSKWHGKLETKDQHILKARAVIDDFRARQATGELDRSRGVSPVLRQRVTRPNIDA